MVPLQPQCLSTLFFSSYFYYLPFPAAWSNCNRSSRPRIILHLQWSHPGQLQATTGSPSCWPLTLCTWSPYPDCPMNFQRAEIIFYAYVYQIATTTKLIGVLIISCFKDMEGRVWRRLDGDREVIVLVILPNPPLRGRWCCLGIVQLHRNLPAIEGIIFPHTPSKK